MYCDLLRKSVEFPLEPRLLSARLHYFIYQKLFEGPEVEIETLNQQMAQVQTANHYTTTEFSSNSFYNKVTKNLAPPERPDIKHWHEALGCIFLFRFLNALAKNPI